MIEVLSDPLAMRAKLKSYFAAPGKEHRVKALQFAALALCLTATMIMPDPAHAQNFESIAQGIRNLLSSTFLRILAVIALIAVGVGWLMGRINTGSLVTVLGGVVIIFSAEWIVDTIAG